MRPPFDAKLRQRARARRPSARSGVAAAETADRGPCAGVARRARASPRTPSLRTRRSLARA
ncbi:hypothetical protein BMA10247_A0651 [Burkholderia mallei NCTC 10247]|nr:hypothetical protein BMA10247_A0651 [Burkholderia mallei NCTC 10247]EDK55759.1 hypothetical protein BMAFMH_E0889 [Burkholderia mallei FMH]EEC34398.1 conserved hypothetical protein [Burkholderia pseudomallei 576]EEP83370.1 conserved hypothetical protein [Burkholderia mallei GB8 horse 4]